MCPIPRPFFDHLKDPAALRWTDLEKGHPVTRTLVTRTLDGETAGFPLVAQAARVRRERVGKCPETVELITSRPASELPLAQWLEANINHWGIETGLHARLDASRNDDRCRWANSLFIHWRQLQTNGRHLTTTDFMGHLAENHDRRAVSAVTSKRFPS